MYQTTPFLFPFKILLLFYHCQHFQILAAALLAVAAAQQYTTPVPILKQINKHNEDGSYSYGYEAADGSYKIETKYPNGEVYGKYGYIDDQGKLREIEYGASRRGFEPAGSEINVAPPTLKSDNYAVAKPLGPNEEDDGQYREDPSVYYKNDPYSTEPARPSYSQPSYSSRFSQPSYQSNYQQPSYQQPATYQQPTYNQPTFRPQTSFNSFNSRPAYNPPPPAYPNYNQFSGHPATNVDIFSGSYTVQYKRR